MEIVTYLCRKITIKGFNFFFLIQRTIIAQNILGNKKRQKSEQYMPTTPGHTQHASKLASMTLPLQGGIPIQNH